MTPSLEQNLRDLLEHVFAHRDAAALLLFDRRSSLARRLAEGYRAALPQAVCLDVDQLPPAQVMAEVEALAPGGLVVLVQSTRFDLKAHRFRLFLFQRGLKVAEHPHLARVADGEHAAYIDALAYDPAFYRPLGRALKARIDAAGRILLVSAAGDLDYRGPFEDAKLNIGDYAGARNVGGQFPIGEVFTEPVDLARCRGTVPVYGYGEADFSLRCVETPFRLEIEDGQVQAAPGAPSGFQEVLGAIRAAEGVVRVRELGFGLNPAFSRSRTVGDVGSYERVAGVHLSLGGRHAVYPKHGLDPRETRYHVDVFCDLERVEIDGETVFDQGLYCVP